MTIINIPTTAEGAVAQLGTVGRLINAKKWERAAIVAALVGPAPGHGPGRGNPSISKAFPFSIEGLRDQGLTGLRSNSTISHYRDVWCRQRPVPALGEAVDLSNLPEWPGIPEEDLTRHTSMTPERRTTLLEAGREAGMPTGAKVVDIAANPKAMQTAIESDPATFQAAREAVDRAEFKEAIRSVGGNADRQGGVPDPEPRWHKLTRRIAMDVLEVKTHVGQLRAEGQQNTADLALRDLREVLAEALSGLEDIPNTIEGIEA